MTLIIYYEGSPHLWRKVLNHRGVRINTIGFQKFFEFRLFGNLTVFPELTKPFSINVGMSDEDVSVLVPFNLDDFPIFDFYRDWLHCQRMRTNCILSTNRISME